MAVRLVSPWMELYHKIEAFFKRDPMVHVIWDEEAKAIDLYVDNAAKADALALIMPHEVKFGNVTVSIGIIPANDEGESSGDIFRDAFESNDMFSFVKTVSGVFSSDIVYVVFKNEVVQYYNDNLGDIYGQRSCLAEDIAREIFSDVDGVYFCTDTPLGFKLGSQSKIEWP